MGPVSPRPQSPFDLAKAKIEQKCEELNLACSICFEPYKDVTRINVDQCYHKYCKPCIEESMHKQMSCPTCRKGFTAKDLGHDFDTQKTIDGLWKKITEKAGLKNVESPYAHVEVKKAAASAPQHDVAHMDVEGPRINQQVQPQPQYPSMNQMPFPNFNQNPNPFQNANPGPFPSANQYSMPQQAPQQVRQPAAANNPLETINVSRDGFKGNNRNFSSITTRDDIRITECFVEGDISAKMGGLVTIDCLINTVNVRDDIHFTRTTASELIRATCGGIKATNSHFKDIRVRDNIVLSNCSASSSLTTTTGEIRIENEKWGIVFDSLTARDLINIKNIVVNGDVKCSCGDTLATNCQLNNVTSRDNITLINSSALSVNSTTGNLNITNSSFDYAFNNLKARDDIKIKNVVVNENVECPTGKTYAENCRLNNVSSREGLTLINSSANTCKTSLGSLTISSIEKLVFQTIEAREDININNIEVKNPIVSKGKFIAKNCKLPAVTCKQIQLENTSVASLNFNTDQNKAVLYLQDSIVEGDLVIEENSLSSIMNMQGISTGSSTMGFGADGFVITADNISQLKILSVFPNTRGTVNGMPYVYTNGEYIPLSGNAFSSETKPTTNTVELKKKEIEIEIRGNGVINGNVIFKGCTGNVKFTGSGKVNGSIQK